MAKKRRRDLSVAEQEKEHAEDTAELKKKMQPEAEQEEDDSLNDPQYLKEYILACKKESYESTKDLRAQQEELWDIYQNKQDYRLKEDWQSKLFIPKLFMVVERASMLIKRAVLQVSKLFNIENDEDEIAPLNNQMRKIRKQIRIAFEQYQQMITTGIPRENLKEIELSVIDLQKQLKDIQNNLDDKNDDVKEIDRRFKSLLKRTNFVVTYSEMIKTAILLGFGCLKRVWNNTEKLIDYVNVDVLNLFISPDYKPFQRKPPKHIIERIEMDLSELIELAESTNKDSGQIIFDLDEVNKIKGDYVNADEEAKTRRRLGLSYHTHTSDKRVEILQFWGKVVSKDGKKSKKEQLMMLANEKYLISKQDIPFKNKKISYNFTVPIVYPHRGVAGVSLVQAEAKLQLTLNNIINMAIDNLNYTVNKMFEYNPNDLQDPQSMLRLYPGKQIKVNSDVQKQAVREVAVTPLKQDVFKIYEVMTNELQEGTIITEFVMGMPGKKAKTLGEVEIKTSESHGYFDVIARDLEWNSIREILQDSYDMLVQFADFPEGKYQFDVGGLSLLLLQREQVDRLIKALTLATKNQQLAQRTKLNTLWKRLLDIWNAGDAYIEDEEIESQMGGQPALMAGQPQMGGGAMPLPAGQQPMGQTALPPGVSQAIQQRAAEDARRQVNQMAQENPQELMRLSA